MPPLAGYGEGSSLLDMVLLAEWEDRAEQGLFRYDVTACPTKVLPGAYGFVAQLNEGRGSKKRPTEFRVDKVSGRFITRAGLGGSNTLDSNVVTLKIASCIATKRS